MDTFAQNLMEDSTSSNTATNSTLPHDSIQVLLAYMGILLLEIEHHQRTPLFETAKLKSFKRIEALRRFPKWT